MYQQYRLAPIKPTGVKQLQAARMPTDDVVIGHAWLIGLESNTGTRNGWRRMLALPKNPRMQHWHMLTHAYNTAQV
jgi:hypothetical protein